jgi:hypothetical protein
MLECSEIFVESSYQDQEGATVREDTEMRLPRNRREV